MKLIPITKGYFAMVDDEDFDFLNQWKWVASVFENTVYPRRRTTLDGKDVTLTMASVVLNLPNGIEIDHKDHNGLNAQKYNLRIATRSQQEANKRLSRNNTSGFKGVVRMKSGRWLAQIKKNGIWMCLGSYDNPADAACAYDLKAIELHGDFACTNKMLGLL